MKFTPYSNVTTYNITGAQLRTLIATTLEVDEKALSITINEGGHPNDTAVIVKVENRTSEVPPGTFIPEPFVGTPRRPGYDFKEGNRG